MIAIPERLRQLLLRRDALAAGVFSWIEIYNDVFEFSHLPFFPEYTDHGPHHVENVLGGIDRLITDEAFSRLTPEDAAVLILATVLHDAALHLSEDGFIALRQSPVLIPRSEWLQDKPWPTLWKEFLSEAYRWDGRKLVSIFGSEGRISAPPDSPMDYSRRDRMLIGEFLRRHHARLAHEFAVLGFPADGGVVNVDDSGALGQYVDVAGLVARSHGIPLRSVFEYLRKSGGSIRNYGPVNAIYLMALLRIADFLEIEADRAPRVVPRIRRLRSPISLGEWRGHQAIQFVDDTLDDREALFIQTAPTDVSTFLKVKKLISTLQTELDTTWAVLGEVYGRVFPELGLTLRRIYSNLDDEGAFARSVDFVPALIYFRTNSNLIKLLMKPLYGDAAAVGVRELLQNAVDAVREFRRYRELLGEPGATRTQSADVTVTLTLDASGTPWLTVEDHGIGMDADIIARYFLTAGSTFRTSDRWRRLNVDESGRSQVYYTGRFGIGLLSAFILGREVEVVTHYVGEEQGFGFTARIDAESIEVKKTQAPIGTSIRIKLMPHVFARLNSPQAWDWYCLQDPVVKQYDINGGELAQKWNVPGPEEAVSASWRRFLPSDHSYAAVDWTFRDAPALTCNGFRVFTSWRQEQSCALGLPLDYPKFSVWDPDARLPLTVRRDDLQTQDLPFQEAAFESVILDYIANALVTAPLTSYGPSSQKWWLLDSRYWGIHKQDATWPLWISTAEGLLPLDQWHLRAYNLADLVVLPLFADDPSLPLFEVDGMPAVLPAPARTSAVSPYDDKDWLGSESLDWFRNPFYNPFSPKILTSRAYHVARNPFDSFRIVGGQFIIIPRTPFEANLLRYAKQKLKEVGESKYYSLLEFGNCSVDSRQVMSHIGARLLDSANMRWPGIVARWFLSPIAEPPAVDPTAGESYFAQVWRETLHGPVIPFDGKQREAIIKCKSPAFANLLQANALAAGEERLTWRAEG